MKIILVDEEAHHYMDMRDDLAEYKRYIAELEALLNAIDSKDKAAPVCNDYPTDTTREEHTSVRWSDYDKETLTQRIFMTGKYYGADRHIERIHDLFPHRTRAAVTAMIYYLGGTVKKGLVHPRIQPKHKGEI